MSTYRLRVGEAVSGFSKTPEMGNPIIVKIWRLNGSFVDYFMPMDGTTVDIPDADDSAFEQVLLRTHLINGAQIQKTVTEE